MPLVVRAVFVAVRLVELLEPFDASSIDAIGREVEHERLDLRAQEVVGARRAERGERDELLAGQELEDDVAVGEVPDHPVVARRDGAEMRCERGRLGAAFVVGERRGGRSTHRSERLRVAVLVEVRLRRCR